MPMPLPDHLYVPRRSVLTDAINAGRPGGRPRLAASPTEAIAIWPVWWLMAGLIVSSMAGWAVALTQMR